MGALISLFIQLFVLLVSLTISLTLTFINLMMSLIRQISQQPRSGRSLTTLGCGSLVLILFVLIVVAGGVSSLGGHTVNQASSETKKDEQTAKQPSQIADKPARPSREARKAEKTANQLQITSDEAVNQPADPLPLQHSREAEKTPDQVEPTTSTAQSNQSVSRCSGNSTYAVTSATIRVSGTPGMQYLGNYSTRAAGVILVPSSLLSESPTDYEVAPYSPNDIIGASFARTSDQKYPNGYNGKLRVEIWVDGQVVKSQDSGLAGSATVVYSPFLDSQCSDPGSESNLSNPDLPNHIPNPDLPNPHISAPHFHSHSHSHFSFHSHHH